MGRQLRCKRALLRSALFVLRRAALLGSALLLGWSSWAAADGGCHADRYDEEVRVAFVSDGDTLRLSDGRKVRLAGINAPEMAHEGNSAQPLADEARNFLSRQLEGTPLLRLRYEEQRQDRYGRLLAHLYLRDGSSLQERLLAEGLAQQLVVPPNSWQSDCYRVVERAARSKRAGLWGNGYYLPLLRNPAAESNGVFRLIGGEVTRVAESRKSLWLTLDSGFSVRIARSDLRRFEEVDLHGLKGRRVVARGWLRLADGRYQVTVRDPTALMRADEW